MGPTLHDLLSNKEEMDHLLPSELARLVLEYLESRGCKKTASVLLEELPELTEVAQLRQQGRQPCSRVWQQSLTNSLLDYAHSKEIIRCAAEANPTTMGYLLEKSFLRDQLRCFVSSATASRRAETAKIARRGKSKNQRPKEMMDESDLETNQPNQNLSSVESEAPNNKIDISFSESSVYTTSATGTDATMVPAAPSPYHQQNQEPAISAPTAGYSSAISVGSGLGSTTHRSPKRKGFLVKRRTHADKDPHLKEYKEQLTQIVLNNTDFHERIANAINRTLAKSEYQDLNRSQRETLDPRLQNHPLSGETSGDNVGDVATGAPPVSYPAPVGSSNNGSIELDSIHQYQQTQGNNLSYKTPSKMSSEVAQTVSKMLLSDPNYHDMFFSDIGVSDFSSSCPPPPSPSPTSRLLTTPEPVLRQFNASEVTLDYLPLGTTAVSTQPGAAGGLESISNDAQPSKNFNSSNTGTNFAASSFVQPVASDVLDASGNNVFRNNNANLPDSSCSFKTPTVNCSQAVPIDSTFPKRSSSVHQSSVPCFTPSSSLCKSNASTPTSYQAPGDYREQASITSHGGHNDVISDPVHGTVDGSSYPTGEGVILPTLFQPSGCSPHVTPIQNASLPPTPNCGDSQHSSSQQNDQSTFMTTPKPLHRVPLIISKTIPFLDNSASFRQDYDSYAKNATNNYSINENAATSLRQGSSSRLPCGTNESFDLNSTAPKLFVNDASPLIPMSVRDALMPILNRRQGSVISIAGTSKAGLGGLLTVVHMPTDDSNKKGSKPLKLLKPKPMQGTELNGPMTVTLPNDIMVTVQDKIVKNLPKQKVPEAKSPKRPLNENTKLDPKTVTSKPLARQQDASPVECLSNHDDQPEQQPMDTGEGGEKLCDSPTTDGNTIMLAAIGAALLQDTPNKLAAAPADWAAATTSSSPRPESSKSSSPSRSNSKNRQSLPSDGQNERSSSAPGQQSKVMSDNTHGSSFRHKISSKSPSLRLQKRSMSEDTSKNLVCPPTFARQTRTSIRLKEKNKGLIPAERQPSSASSKVLPYQGVESEDDCLPSLENDQLEEKSGNRPTADVASDKTLTLRKEMDHSLNDDRVPKRGSQSTPSYKRKKSYVRVLEFQTPNKTPSNLDSLKERRPRSLFNSPSPNKITNSTLPNCKSSVVLSKKNPNKRTMDVILEESINDSHSDKPNDSSPRPTKKIRLSIAEQNSTGSLANDGLPGTGVAVGASLPAVPSCHAASNANVAHSKTAHPTVNFLEPTVSCETQNSKQNAAPALMSDFFTTPMKFSDAIVLEAPTPINQGIMSTIKKLCTVSKNELNTPVPSQFPPPSPCPKTPYQSRVSVNREHFPDDTQLADKLDLQLVAEHNKRSILEVDRTSLPRGRLTVPKPCDPDLTPKINETKNHKPATAGAATLIREMSPTTMGIALEMELQKSLEKSNQSLPDKMEEDGNTMLSKVTATSDVDSAAVKACVPVIIPKICVTLPPSSADGSSSNTDTAFRSIEEIVDCLERGEINPETASCSETKKSKKKKKDKKENKKTKTRKNERENMSETPHERKSNKGKKKKKEKKNKEKTKTHKERKNESLHETDTTSIHDSVLSNDSSRQNVSNQSCYSNTSIAKGSYDDRTPDRKLLSSQPGVMSENERGKVATPCKVSPLRSGATASTRKPVLSASKVKVVVSPLRKKHGKLSLSKSLWKSPKSSKKETPSPVCDAVSVRNLFGSTSDDDWVDEDDDGLPDISVRHEDQVVHRNENFEMNSVQNDNKRVLKNNRSTESSAKVGKMTSSDNSLATVVSCSTMQELLNDKILGDQPKSDNLCINVTDEVNSSGNGPSCHNQTKPSGSSSKQLSVTLHTEKTVQAKSPSNSRTKKIVKKTQNDDMTARRSHRRKNPKNADLARDTHAKPKENKSKEISGKAIVSESEESVVTTSNTARRVRNERKDENMEMDEPLHSQSDQESHNSKGKDSQSDSVCSMDLDIKETDVVASRAVTEGVAGNAFTHWGSGAKRPLIQSPRVPYELDGPAAGSQSPADVMDKWTAALASDGQVSAVGSAKEQSPRSSRYHGKREGSAKSFESRSRSTTTGFPVSTTEGRVATPIAVKRLRSALQGGTSPTSGTSRSQPQSPCDGSTRLQKQSFAQSPRVAAHEHDEDQFSDSFLELDSKLALLDGPAEEDTLSEHHSYLSVPTPGKHLASFTLLPKTPEKEMGNICRSMVKEGAGAMVAMPCSQLQMRGHNVLSLTVAPSVATATKKISPPKHSSCKRTSSGGSVSTNNLVNDNSQLRPGSSQRTSPREVDDKGRENHQQLEGSNQMVKSSIDIASCKNTNELEDLSQAAETNQKLENVRQATGSSVVNGAVNVNRQQFEHSIRSPSPDCQDDEDNEDDQEYRFVVTYSEFMNLTEINIEDNRLVLEYPPPSGKVSGKNNMDPRENIASMSSNKTKSTVDEVDSTNNISLSNDARKVGATQGGQESYLTAKRLRDKESTDDTDLNKKSRLNTGLNNDATRASPLHCKAHLPQYQPCSSELPFQSGSTEAKSSAIPCASSTATPSLHVTSTQSASAVDGATTTAVGPSSGAAAIVASELTHASIIAPSAGQDVAPLLHLGAPGHVQVNALRARTGSSGGCSTTSSTSSGQLHIAESSPRYCSPQGSPLHCESTDVTLEKPHNEERDKVPKMMSRQVKKSNNLVYSKRASRALVKVEQHKSFNVRSNVIVAKPLIFGSGSSKTDITEQKTIDKRVRSKKKSAITNLEKDSQETRRNLSIADAECEPKIPESRRHRDRRSKSSNRRGTKGVSASPLDDVNHDKRSRSSSSGKGTIPEQPVAVEAKENLATSGSHDGANKPAEETAGGSVTQPGQQTSINDARPREPLVEYGTDRRGMRFVPPTPGKYLFTSPPCGEAGMRLSASDGSHCTTGVAHLFPSHHLDATPRHHHHTWPNPYTSTPMSSGCGVSYATQDALASVNSADFGGQKLAGIVGGSAMPAGFNVAGRVASAEPDYLDRPPKTPGFIDTDAMHERPSERSPDVNNSQPRQNERTGIPAPIPSTPERNLNSSSLSEIPAPAESRAPRVPPQVMTRTGASVLPKKSKEEMTKFIEMFHKKMKKK